MLLERHGSTVVFQAIAHLVLVVWLLLLSMVLLLQEVLPTEPCPPVVLLQVDQCQQPHLMVPPRALLPETITLSLLPELYFQACAWLPLMSYKYNKIISFTL
jgi:hypothetical protein